MCCWWFISKCLQKDQKEDTTRALKKVKTSPKEEIKKAFPFNSSSTFAAVIDILFPSIHRYFNQAEKPSYVWNIFAYFSNFFSLG